MDDPPQSTSITEVSTVSREDVRGVTTELLPRTREVLRTNILPPDLLVRPDPLVSTTATRS